MNQLTKNGKCHYCDDHGFCNLYSSGEVVWKCKGYADCERYVEGTEDG